MRTIYCTTANITSSGDKVVNLEDYRARLAVQGSLAPQPGEEWDGVIQGPWAPPRRRREPARQPLLSVREELRPSSGRRGRPCRAAAALEIWCSVGVILMTLAFTLRVLVL